MIALFPPTQHFNRNQLFDVRLDIGKFAHSGECNMSVIGPLFKQRTFSRCVISRVKYKKFQSNGFLQQDLPFLRPSLAYLRHDPPHLKAKSNPVKPFLFVAELFGVMCNNHLSNTERFWWWFSWQRKGLWVEQSGKDIVAGSHNGFRLTTGRLPAESSGSQISGPVSDEPFSLWLRAISQRQRVLE